LCPQTTGNQALWGVIPTALMELLSQIFYDDNVFCSHKLLYEDNRQSGLHPAGGQLWGMGFGFVRWQRLVTLNDVHLLLKVVCFEIVNIGAVPLSTFLIVPLPFTFCPAAGHLAIFKPNVG
jgi:hypothetical protein